MGRNDDETTIADLKALLVAFSRERDWEQFHHPKELGLALAIEVGELLEHFRYLSPEMIDSRLEQPERRTALAHELADCLWMILRMADVCGIDLSAALEEKLRLAAAKYPAAQVRGKPFKYSEYKSSTES